MTATFSDTSKLIADEIITLSRLLDTEMETWHDVVARVHDSTSKNVSAGFITKPNATSGIELVVDIQAPPVEQKARLRIWAIEIVQDNDGNERFNNVQLNYHLDYAQARQLIEQTNALTLNDLANILHDSANQLESIAISDLAGKIEASQKQLGKRYDLDSDELNSVTEDLHNELLQAMNIVLERLKQSAESKTSK